jgi:DNA adenine methylase
MTKGADLKLLPRPFLKWAGGKTKLLTKLRARIPSSWDPSRDHYHEPFLGAGALYFSLLPTHAHLSDANADLVIAWQAVRNDVDGVVAELVRWRDAYVKDPETTYYAVRLLSPEKLGLAERAARLIFLNKACFNGLYRVNKKGIFNVPWGKNPKAGILDEVNLRNCARALSQGDGEIECRDFSKSGAVKKRESVKAGALVYFDPPYAPVSKTSNFTSFTVDKFGRAEQVRLVEVAAKIAERGAHVIVSQSADEALINLYREKGFACDLVYAPRGINSVGTGRGMVGEYIIHNCGAASVLEEKDHPAEASSVEAEDGGSSTSPG